MDTYYLVWKRRDAEGGDELEIRKLSATSSEGAESVAEVLTQHIKGEDPAAHDFLVVQQRIEVNP